MTLLHVCVSHAKTMQAFILDNFNSHNLDLALFVFSSGIDRTFQNNLKYVP